MDGCNVPREQWTVGNLRSSVNGPTLTEYINRRSCDQSNTVKTTRVVLIQHYSIEETMTRTHLDVVDAALR